MSNSAASLFTSLTTPTPTPTPLVQCSSSPLPSSTNFGKWSFRIRASSSSAAAPGVDLSTLQTAISKKDSNAAKEALDQLVEVGWARKWSSQPYVSRRTFFFQCSFSRQKAHSPSSQLKQRHAEELASLGYSGSSSNEKEKDNLDTLLKAIAGVSVGVQSDNSKPSKSVKRREKRAQQEAVREQRIQEEQSNIVSDRVIENEKLERNLEPLGLTINEIKPDGHCLYRAVENQLVLHSGGSSPYTYLELRQMAAGYMTKHATDFLPFFLSANMSEGELDDSVVERFENYCREVETTAAWGGQLELGALTHVLKKHIMIFSGSFPM